MHPTDFSLRGAIEALNEGLVSSEELTRAHLDGIEKLNPRLNAYVTVTVERALEQVLERALEQILVQALVQVLVQRLL